MHGESECIKHAQRALLSVSKRGYVQRGHCCPLAQEVSECVARIVTAAPPPVWGSRMGARDGMHRCMVRQI